MNATGHRKYGLETRLAIARGSDILVSIILSCNNVMLHSSKSPIIRAKNLFPNFF